MITAGVPPGQKLPMGHKLALAALTLPAAQPKPGGAVQGVHVALVAAPVAALKVPVGHSVALREARGQKAPAGHATGPPLAQ